MKLGRRKFQRGRVVEGSWILGFIELESGEVRLEICPDNKRDQETLLTLIQYASSHFIQSYLHISRKHVAINSTILTDCWKGYNNLSQNDFEHFCVNHSRFFVDPETGVDTNRIEAQWRPLRKRLSRGGIQKEKLADHLCEFLYMKDVARRGVDPFLDILENIKIMYPV